uniref:CLIP domain-containing serine protease n=1 Tax=Anopheles dirus TaxID=7168 RepID=A0A2C9GV95_9DIPT
MPRHKVLLLLGCIVFVSLESAAALNRDDPCQTPNGQTGKCVPLRSCYSVAKLLIKEEGMTSDDQTHLKRSNCGNEGRSVLVCCPAKNLRNRFSKVDLLPPGECGTAQEDRIFGGEVASIFAYPWLARIRYFKGNNRYGFHCGGVLIHHKYVLTAAHCIEGVPSSWIVYQVRLGEFDTTTTTDCQNDVCADPVRDVLINDHIVHPDYYKENGADYNDIAMLQLAESVEFTEFIQPICLPLTPAARSVDHTGKYVTVAGWGQTENSSSSTKKLHLQVPVLSNEACAEAFSTVHLEIIPTQVCAGGEKGRDSCRGDSGGPLMSRTDGVTKAQFWHLVGLVSFGLEQCGTDGVPGVYTRIGEYMDWVIDTMS